MLCRIVGKNEIGGTKLSNICIPVEYCQQSTQPIGLWISDVMTHSWKTKIKLKFPVGSDGLNTTERLNK